MLSYIPEVKQVQHIDEIIVKFFLSVVVVDAFVGSRRRVPELRADDTSRRRLAREPEPTKDYTDSTVTWKLKNKGINLLINLLCVIGAEVQDHSLLLLN